MERKTIGSFIAALRKANGMTQKELADRLLVSDKAVSRWERDECAPDISLIPVIAELFGVTSDELLMGERKSSPSAPSEYTSAKTEKQQDRLLKAATLRHKNSTLISIGLTSAGLIAGLLINFGNPKTIECERYEWIDSGYQVSERPHIHNAHSEKPLVYNPAVPSLAERVNQVLGGDA